MSTKQFFLFFWMLVPLTAQSAWDLHSTLGAQLEHQGRYGEAATEFAAALRVADGARVAETLDSLAVVYREMGDYAPAERSYLRAIKLLESANPPQPLQLASAMQNLGALRLVQGRASQAEPFYRKAYELRVQVLDPDAPPVAMALHGLAEVAHERRRYAEAEELYRRSAGLLEAAYGSTSLAVADVWHNWAELYRETERDAQARPLLEGAAASYEKAAPLHPKLAIILRNLAELEASGGHNARAQELFDRALSICGTSLRADHPQTGIILQAYARFLRNTNRKTEAKLLDKRARAILPATYTVDAAALR